MTYIIYTFFCVVMGSLLCKEKALAKWPGLEKSYYSQISEFQDWLGVIATVIGLMGLIDALFSIGLIVSPAFFAWFLLLVVAFSLFASGIIIGKNKIQSLIKNEKVKEITDKLFEKFVPYQSKIGMACAISGLLILIVDLAI